MKLSPSKTSQDLRNLYPSNQPLPEHGETEGVAGVSSVEERPWGPLTAVFVGLVIFFAAQLLVAPILVSVVLFAKGWSIHRIESWLTGAVMGQFVFLLVAELAVILGVFWFMRLRHVPLRRIGWTRPRLQHISVAAIGFVAYFGAYIVVAMLVSKFAPGINLDQKQQIGFDNVTTTIDLVLTGISLVVLPPLAEETLFRGFILTGIRQRFRIWPAAIITSVIFAVGHLEFGSGAPLLWVAAIDTFVLSMVLCYVREKTSSLWPGILIHAAKNALAFSVLFLFR